MKTTNIIINISLPTKEVVYSFGNNKRKSYVNVESNYDIPNIRRKVGTVNDKDSIQTNDFITTNYNNPVYYDIVYNTENSNDSNNLYDYDDTNYYVNQEVEGIDNNYNDSQWTQVEGQEIVNQDFIYNEQEEEICHGFNEVKDGEYISVEGELKPVYYSHKFVNNLDTISEKSNEDNETQKKYNFVNAKNSLIDKLKKGVPNLIPKI